MAHSPSTVDSLESTDYLLEAEQQWETQGITSSQLTTFSQHRSPVVEQEILEKATVQQVAQAFRPLFPGSAKTTTPKVSANTLTMSVPDASFYCDCMLIECDIYTDSLSYR